uniref:Uncharacterized protein n=1 Tax=Peronospora matthiolae TaxID=2874970 RepID=A0AAV1UHG4_9STRA
MREEILQNRCVPEPNRDGDNTTGSKSDTPDNLHASIPDDDDDDKLEEDDEVLNATELPDAGDVVSERDFESDSAGKQREIVTEVDSISHIIDPVTIDGF